MSRTLPFSSWPEPDRLAWATIFAEGDVFDGRGPGAHWAKPTRQAAYYDYRRWLGFLADHDPAALAKPLADRVTPARLRAYLESMNELSRVTTATYVRRLLSILRAAAPERSREWLAEQARQIGRAHV